MNRPNSRDHFAISLANSHPRFESAPRNVSNPGVYFGAIAGWNACEMHMRSEVVKILTDNGLDYARYGYLVEKKSK